MTFASERGFVVHGAFGDLVFWDVDFGEQEFRGLIFAAAPSGAR